MRFRFWLEAVTAALSGTLGAVTLLWHDWIELASGTGPDHGSGSAEWGVAGVLLAASALLAVAARREWCRAAPA